MYVHKLEEHGYESALFGMSLSYYDHVENIHVWWDAEKKERAAKRAKALAFKGGGHNKFLESIQVWFYVQAPRTWWSEFDTYRIGMTKNSSSTMHTLDKRTTWEEDYEIGTSESAIAAFNNCLYEYKEPTSHYYKDISRLKLNLPEGWLQERELNFNYMTLQNIAKQRKKHRLKFWNQFLEPALSLIDHPELITPEIF
jgi:hypothetical protein